jgi:hypothetical protein
MGYNGWPPLYQHRGIGPLEALEIEPQGELADAALIVIPA